MVQILNISDKTAISTISSLCNDDPTKNVELSTVDQARPWMIIACYASNIFCLVASMMVCVNGMSEILGPNWLRVSCPEKIGHRP
jgi:hypothetical protein